MTNGGKLALAIGAILIVPKLFAKRTVTGYDQYGRPIYGSGSGSVGGYIDPRTGQYVRYPYGYNPNSGGATSAIGSLLRGLLGGTSAQQQQQKANAQQQSPRAGTGGSNPSYGSQAPIAPRNTNPQFNNDGSWKNDAFRDVFTAIDHPLSGVTASAGANIYNGIDWGSIGVAPSPDIYPIQANVADDRTPYDFGFNDVLNGVNVAIDPATFDANWFNNPMTDFGFDYVNDISAPINMDSIPLGDYSQGLYDALGMDYGAVLAPEPYDPTPVEYDYYN